MDEKRQGEAINIPSENIPNGKKLFLESYGCAMNFSDSEVVASILIKEGYQTTTDELEADIVLINTCSIRDNAEDRVRKTLEVIDSKDDFTNPWRSYDFKDGLVLNSLTPSF